MKEKLGILAVRDYLQHVEQFIYLQSSLTSCKCAYSRDSPGKCRTCEILNLMFRDLLSAYVKGICP